MIGRRGDGLRLLNAERQMRYVQEIRRALRLSRRAKVKCEGWGALVLFVEGVTGIHRTTLRRNRNYRNMIWSFYIVTYGLTEEVSDREASRDILLVKLSKLRAHLGVVEGELQKWRAMANSNGDIESVKYELEKAAGTADRVAFTDTALVLVEVLKRCDGVLDIDFGSGRVLDLSAKPSERVVAERPRTKAFIDWLHAAGIEFN